MHPPFYIFQFLHNRELNELYACISIRSFAFSMITIFVPIFLLTIGFSLTDVLVYLLVQGIAFIAGVFLAGIVDARLGFKHAILLSNPIFVVFFALLYTLQSQQWPLWLLASIWGIANSLFWVSYHTDFSRTSSRGKRENEVGFSKILASMATVAGPIIGGVILTFFGFPVLFVLVSLLLITSSIPLFFSPDMVVRSRFSLHELFDPKNYKDALAFIAHGAEGSMLLEIWPVFVFLFVFSDLELIGFTATIAFLFSFLVVIALSMGKDAWKGMILKAGALVNGSIWVLKFFAQIPVHIFSLDAGHGATRSLLTVSMDALTYDKAREGDEIAYVMLREISIQTGKIAFIAVLLLLGGNLAPGFAIAALASLGYLLYEPFAA